MAEIVVGEGHNGGAISAKPGDQIIVRLPENPTTGYHWRAESPASGVLDLQSDEFMQAGSQAPGAGGIRILRYLARGAGNTSVALELARPWEANTPRSQFKIQVAVSR
jgi:inhibitor of cysteine peptidase